MVDEFIKIENEPLNTEAAIALVEDAGAGAVNVFIGTVRNQTNSKHVIGLEFESYIPMALKEMSKIAQQAKDKWPITAIAIHHRVGKLKIGELPVVIAVSSPHRKAGFEACQFAIDTLKETVPIWKKELFEDGSHWVAAHP